MEQVIAAAKAANAHEFITQISRWLRHESRRARACAFPAGRNSASASPGRFWPIPTILLLDEPTSSVEPDSEAAIIAALDRLMAGRTTVLTSHRPSLINQADVVYVIEEGGRITESGPPLELRERNRWFSRFMRSAEGAGISAAELAE